MIQLNLLVLLHSQLAHLKMRCIHHPFHLQLLLHHLLLLLQLLSQLTKPLTTSSLQVEVEELLSGVTECNMYGRESL